jgi:hypothetical protein
LARSHHAGCRGSHKGGTGRMQYWSDYAPQSNQRRQTRHLGIRHHLRHKICGQRHPGQQITTKPLRAVMAKSPQPRSETPGSDDSRLAIAPSTHVWTICHPSGCDDVEQALRGHSRPCVRRLRASRSGPGVGHPDVPGR